MRLASIFTKKILRLVQLYAIIAFITLIGCGGRHSRKRKLLDGGGSIASINNMACCWLQFPSEIDLMTEEEWDNHDTSQENADVIIDIGMCGKEKAAEKTVNCGVLKGNLLSYVYFTQKVLLFRINILPL